MTKTVRKKYTKHKEEDLVRAVAEIKNGHATYRSVSEKYGIPIATLCDKVKNRVAVSSKMGKNCTIIAYCS